MKTECKRNRMKFQDFGKRKVVGHFDGGTISSDGGNLLLREIERRLEITDRLAACITDYRNPKVLSIPSQHWYLSGFMCWP